MALDAEKEKLFNTVRLKLGGGVRKIQLTEEAMCSFLDLAVSTYAERAQNFILISNWANLYGKNLSNTDLAFAMSVRTMDIAKDYSQYFSKQVGLQQSGTKWELKKDYVTLEEGKQVYVIPAGREINKVLWITPPTTDQALFSTYGGLNVGFGGGGVGQMGMGAAAMFGGVNSAYGMGAGIWALPAYDVALMAADISYKNSLIRSELTFKVTAGPDGTHLLHLISTPGSRLTFGAGGLGYHSLRGCYCWYTYYDTTPDNVDECRRMNPDVILSPDQIPLETMDYSLMNSPTKAIVRQLLIAEAAETLGLVRGTFSGNINMLASPLSMDYQIFVSMGQREKENALRMLDERFKMLSPYETLKRQAEMAQSITEIKKSIPLGIYAK